MNKIIKATRLVVIVVIPAVTLLSGCITAFTPAREFCTLDKDDTTIKPCKPEKLPE